MMPELNDHDRTPCEVWSRVMGYHRPVSYANAGKQQEHADRLCFSETPRARAGARPCMCDAGAPVEQGESLHLLEGRAHG